MLSKIVLLTAILAVVLAVPVKKELTQEQADRLAAWTKGQQRMWEISGQTEGDMLIQPGQRNGVIDTRLRWANNVIPYELDPIFTPEQANVIHAAVREFWQKTCITVRPRVATDTNYVYVTGENTGCWSWVGQLGGQQQLNLQPNGCVWTDIVIHEFLHAVGFYHQQSATERDNYVAIQWGNIQSGTEHNFDKYDENFITSFGQAYDYGSIMHYGEYAFSSNGQPTIVPFDGSWIGRLGTAQEMSIIDQAKVIIMYTCQCIQCKDSTESEESEQM